MLVHSPLRFYYTEFFVHWIHPLFLQMETTLLYKLYIPEYIFKNLSIESILIIPIFGNHAPSTREYFRNVIKTISEFDCIMLFTNSYY